ncbi:MAG: glycosyltransferase family 4 protein [Chloroflexia bacterium]|nr:glycosyltransferase family 4 protein [Chloroflexia bacterium]
MPSKRILICAVQVPFARGGAELLVDGLLEALREHGHQVEVVQIPFAWAPDKRSIVKGCLVWRLLDLERVNEQSVDQVICTKFPSYVVRHPQKVVWLVHQHRQAYDWYGSSYSDFGYRQEDREVRQVIQRIDRRCLGEARRIYTISNNVSHRLAHYNGLRSTPLYPPSRYRQQLRPGPYGDYVLSLGRLDRAKRVDLLLQAMVHVSAPLRCVVAGTGAEGPALERLARQEGLSERVEFAGYVDEPTLVSLYAGARAVFYAPVDEDYGFATVEAFQAQKPVVTTDDAGGVLEFVQHRQSGLVSPPEPAAIAAHLEELAADAALAERLGRAGHERVQDITWERVVRALVR